ncbi:histamine N-methyltransferase A-like [Glandiceps talaboti]
MEKMPQILINNDAYIDNYEAVYAKGLNERCHICEPDMKNLFAHLNMNKDKEIRVLAVGSGSGSNDFPILNVLSGLNQKISYTVVDPLDRQIERFKSMVQRQGDKWKGVTYDYHVKTIQDYVNERKQRHIDQDEKFDIIHALHCVYYFPNDAKIFRELYDLLRNPGTFLIRQEMYSEQGGWVKIWNYYNQFYKNSTHPYYDVDVVLASTRQQLHGIEINTSYRENSPINITECFIEESEIGNKMLSCFFQCEDFRKEIRQETAKSLLKYLKEECSIIDGDKVILPGYEVDIIIKK